MTGSNLQIRRSNPADLVRASDHLRSLLNHEARYRRRWAVHARRQGGSPNVDAVSAVLVDHLWRHPGDRAPSSLRSLRDRVARALDAHTFTPQTANLIADAFDFTPAHRDQLLAYLSIAMATAASPAGAQGSTLPHRTLSLHELHRVGPDRSPVEHRTVHTLQALVDGVSSYRYAFDTDRAVVDAVRGATTSGQLLPHPTVDGYWYCILEFSRPMRAGEVRVFEYVTKLSYDVPPAPEMRRAMNPQLQSLSVRVDFDRTCVPTEVWWCKWEDADQSPTERKRVMVDEFLSVSAHVDRAGNSLVGFSWSFD